jgi:hypothetical protein
MRGKLPGLVAQLLKGFPMVLHAFRLFVASFGEFVAQPPRSGMIAT